MPKIPTYQRRIDEPKQLRTRAIAPRETTDLNIQPIREAAGQSLQTLGGAIADYGALKIQQDNERAKARALNQFSKASMDWSMNLRERMENVEDGAPEFSKNLLTDFDKFSQEMVNSENNKHAKSLLIERFTGLRNSLMDKSLRFEAQESLASRERQATSAYENFSKLVYNDPDLKTLSDSLQIYSDSIESMNFPPGKKEKLLTAGKQSIAFSAGMKMAEVAPKFLLKQLQDQTPQWASSLEVAQIDSLRNKAIRNMEERKEVNRKLISMTYADTMENYRDGKLVNTGITKEQLVTAYGQEVADLMWRDLESWREYAKLKGEASGKSIEQGLEEIKKISSEPGNLPMERAAAKLKIGVILEREKKIRENPLEVTFDDYPQVAASYHRFIKSMQEGQAPEQIQLARAEYVTEALAMQEKLGAPSPKIVPPAYKTQAERVFSLNPTPDQKIEYFNQMQMVWGDKYDQAINELGDVIPPGDLLIGELKNQAAKKILADITPERIRELEVRNAESKSLREQQIEQESFLKLKKSYAYSIGSSPRIEMWRGGIQRLALRYMDDGSSYDVALTRAISQTIDSNYQFLDVGKDSIRVPLSYNLTPINKDQARRGIGVIAKKLKTGDGIKFTDNRGFYQTGEEAEKLKRQIMQTSLGFLTSMDDSKLVPYILTADGDPRFLTDTTTNELITYTWDEVLNNGVLVDYKMETLTEEKQRSLKERYWR